MKTFEEVHYKDMISNNGIVLLLEEVGFERLSFDPRKNEGRDSGYLLKSIPIQDIEVYLKYGLLKIHLTPAYIKLEIYKRCGFFAYYNTQTYNYSDWAFVKKIIYKKDGGVNAFRDFLLLSICRDSFLDPEDEKTIIDVEDKYWGFDSLL